MSAYSIGDYNASAYKDARPTYSHALFDFVMDYAGQEIKDTVIDVASGTGQATIALADYVGFNRVIGVEPSDVMRGAAEGRPNISYHKATSSDFADTLISASIIEERSAALVTVATAAHWFDMPPFFRQAHRALRSGGTMAIWGYCYCRLLNEGDKGVRCAQLIDQYGIVLMKSFWDPGRVYLDTLYSDPQYVPPSDLFKDYKRIILPSEDNPSHVIYRNTTMAAVKSFWKTWSCYKNFLDHHRKLGIDFKDPVDELVENFLEVLEGDVPESQRLGLNRKVEIIWPVGLVLARAV